MMILSQVSLQFLYVSILLFSSVWTCVYFSPLLLIALMSTRVASLEASVRDTPKDSAVSSVLIKLGTMKKCLVIHS